MFHKEGEHFRFRDVDEGLCRINITLFTRKLHRVSLNGHVYEILLLQRLLHFHCL